MGSGTRPVQTQLEIANLLFKKIRYGWKTELVADFESIERAAENFVSYPHKGVEIVSFFTFMYCVLKFLELFGGSLFCRFFNRLEIRIKFFYLTIY